jgi:hypothetical protein
MRVLLTVFAAAVVGGVTALGPVAGGGGSALACAGLIGSNGAVNLGRTTTLAAYHNGVEHYVTAFEFQGGGGEFGSLIPLPGVPTKVEKGGDWTLQRLILETNPPVFRRAALSSQEAPAGGGVEVLQEVRIDALDLTVLRGGSAAVAEWATEHGFRLSPDAPEVLEFYAQRSPIFLAAVFDGSAAAERGQQLGDGTPVHLTIPTDNPWVPLRILGLGKQPADLVQADVFLLTDSKPVLLFGPAAGVSIDHSAPATPLLLDDLRSDQGMEWVPRSAWLTKVGLNVNAGDLKFDLAVDASGAGNPSRIDAGLDLPGLEIPAVAGAEGSSSDAVWAVTAVALLALLVAVAVRLRPGTLGRWPDAR